MPLPHHGQQLCVQRSVHAVFYQDAVWIAPVNHGDDTQMFYLFCAKMYRVFADLWYIR
jgi:hypothetical protein